MKIIVQRNGQHFGPYPTAVVQKYLAEGFLLPQDLAREDNNILGQWMSLSTLLAKLGIASRTATVANSLSQTLKNLIALDLKLILPWREISSMRWLQNKRLIGLAAIGLAPAIALAIAPIVDFSYWAIAFYFSSLWAMFFYYLFKTSQIQTKLCFVCFFFTGVISIAVLLVLQQIPPWSTLYELTTSKVLPLRFCGFFFGVGLSEELCKAAILFWLVRRPGSLLIPQTVVFYGMMSGLGFGIYEGVNYQQTVNRTQVVDVAYFLDIVRLTSLPFLHAIWTGISGYFVSFASLFPSKRYGLWVVAIVIPAGFHAVYDSFGWGFVGLTGALLSVILLMTYLSNSVQMQKHLGMP